MRRPEEIATFEVADNIKALAIEKGGWVEVEKEFHKSGKLDKIVLTISLKVDKKGG